MKFSSLNNVVFLLIMIGAGLSIFHIISPWFVIGNIIGYLLFILVVSSNIQLNFFVQSHNYQAFPEEKSVAITFDDGPVENTLEILDLLKKYRAKASFFCIGKEAERNPKILKRIISEGHLIGNHTYSHTRKMGFLSTQKIIAEITECDNAIKNITGLNMHLFRPPFGIINPKTKRALEQTGHEVIGWNIRSYDAVLSSKDYVLKRILRKVRPGGVILLHDSNLKTGYILEQLLIFLQTNEYTTVRVDNLFNIDAYS